MEESKLLEIKATLRAILYGIIGSLIFAVLYYFGFIISFGAYLICYLSCLGYKKVTYNEVDKRGYIILFIVSTVLLVLMMIPVLAIIISIDNSLNIWRSFIQIFKNFANNSAFCFKVFNDFISCIIFISLCLFNNFITDKKVAKVRVPNVPSIFETLKTDSKSNGEENKQVSEDKLLKFFEDDDKIIDQIFVDEIDSDEVDYEIEQDEKVEINEVEDDDGTDEDNEIDEDDDVDDEDDGDYDELEEIEAELDEKIEEIDNKIK